jgi:hypothetical protein
LLKFYLFHSKNFEINENLVVERQWSPWNHQEISKDDQYFVYLYSEYFQDEQPTEREEREEMREEGREELERQTLPKILISSP